jgi:MFS family permease
MWGIPAFVFFFAFLHRVAPGAVVKEIMQAFNASAEIVGLLSAMYFYAYAGFMIPAGLLIDRFGVRRVFAAGSVVMGLGSLLMGLAASRGGLMTGRFLVGAGATVTFIGCLKIAADWFPPSHFGTMSAVTATVGILGALGGTAPLAALVALAGWRGAFTIIAVVTLAGAAACYAVVRDRPPGTSAIAAAAQGEGAVLRGMMKVLRNRHTWPPFAVFFFFYAAWGNLMLWSIPFLHDIYGLTTTSAGAYASAVSFALLFSAPLTGYLSDRVLRRRKLPYTVLSACLFLFWTALALTAGALPLWGAAAVLFGMGAVGGAFVLTRPIAREVNAVTGGHRGGRVQYGRLRRRRADAEVRRAGAGRRMDRRDGRRSARLSGSGLRRRIQSVRAIRPDRDGTEPAPEGDARAQHLPRALSERRRPASLGQRNPRARHRSVDDGVALAEMALMRLDLGQRAERLEQVLRVRHRPLQLRAWPRASRASGLGLGRRVAVTAAMISWRAGPTKRMKRVEATPRGRRVHFGDQSRASTPRSGSRRASAPRRPRRGR